MDKEGGGVSGQQGHRCKAETGDRGCWRAREGRPSTLCPGFCLKTGWPQERRDRMQRQSLEQDHWSSRPFAEVARAPGGLSQAPWGASWGARRPEARGGICTLPTNWLLSNPGI